jgi:hypothetical protein
MHRTPRPVICAAYGAVTSCRNPGIPDWQDAARRLTNSSLIGCDHHVAGFDHCIDFHPWREMQPFG